MLFRDLFMLINDFKMKIDRIPVVNQLSIVQTRYFEHAHPHFLNISKLVALISK